MTILTHPKTFRRQLARARTPDLTPDEMANVRRAIGVLRIRFGGFAKLAVAIGVPLKGLQTAVVRSRKPSVAIALRAARLAGVPLEEILAGSWPPEGACPHCGRT